MSTAAFYRQMAAEARDKALGSTDPFKTELLELSQKWEGLAEFTEQEETASKALGDAGGNRLQKPEGEG